MVPGEADAEQIVIHANHVDMVRFPSKERYGYRTISEHLQIMAMDAARAIDDRWEMERRVIAGKKEHSKAGRKPAENK